MTLPLERRNEKYVAMFFGLALMTAMIHQSVVGMMGVLTALTLCFASWFLLRFRDLNKVVGHLALLLFGLLYIPLLLGHMPLLRALPQGREWIFLILFIVMFCDTFAYFVGSAVGCKKLYAAISPNKSIEGACGGLVGSVLGSLLFKFLFFSQLGVTDAVLLGLGLGVIGQIGDLFESLLKRSSDVKDSGTMIPGHGGILDRLDSLLFAFPPAYYFALLAGYG